MENVLNISADKLIFLRFIQDNTISFDKKDKLGIPTDLKRQFRFTIRPFITNDIKEMNGMRDCKDARGVVIAFFLNL